MTANLTTEEGVKEYLRKTRAELVEPCSGKKTVIVKHAQPYVKNKREMSFDVTRQNFEVEALRRVKRLIPDDALVTVPEVYLFDETAHVIIMEDCGETSVPLKQLMREGRLSPPKGVMLGEALGEFIGRLHMWGKDKGAWEYFDGNEQARQLSAWAYYGRIHATLDPSQNMDVPVLRDPPLEVSAEDLEVIKKLGEDMGYAIRTSHETLVMGDFWPGNVIVSSGEVERVYVVDWEMCRPGLSGIEIGQFCAEIGFVKHFHPEYATTAEGVLSGFMRAYSARALPEKEVLRVAKVHSGVHTVMISTRVKWGEREATRVVVEGGVRGIVEGSDIRPE